MIRTTAPYCLPADIAELLAAFELTLPALLTTTSAKAEKTAAVGAAFNAMHYALPQRQLARAINPATVAATAPRGYVEALRLLADRTGTTAAAIAHNGCRFATGGCIAGCLASAGHGGLSVSVTAARGRRTLAMVADPVTYARALVFAIAAQSQRAARAGLPLAVRLCGTDETPHFSRLAPFSVADAAILRRRFGVTIETGDRLNVAEALAPMRESGALWFYEYLKAPVGSPYGPESWRAAGWADVTASFAADRGTACADAVAAVRAGFRVAFPVRLTRGAAPLRAVRITTASGDAVTLPAVDGDATGDARWRDPAGCAVVLREKRARGADPVAAARFLLPDAPVVPLADGTVELIR
jgi:hypothetical protein